MKFLLIFFNNDAHVELVTKVYEMSCVSICNVILSFSNLLRIFHEVYVRVFLLLGLKFLERNF